MHGREQNAGPPLITQTEQCWAPEADGIDHGPQVFNLIFQRNRTRERI